MAPLVKRGSVLIAVGEGRKQRGDTPASSPIYRNIAAKDSWPQFDGCTTLYELFDRSCTKVEW